MPLTRMVTRADRLNVVSFDLVERDRVKGFDDAVVGKTPQHSCSFAYSSGYIEGKFKLIDWIMEDIRSFKRELKL